jgi:hypothetical protein
MIVIGEIKVYPEWTVTPIGTRATKEVNFLFEDHVQTIQRTSGAGVLLGILFCWTIIGLLFFFMKTFYTSGNVVVTAWGEGGFRYSTTISIVDPLQVTAVQQQVTSAQNIASQAREVARRSEAGPPPG